MGAGLCEPRSNKACRDNPSLCHASIRPADGHHHTLESPSLFSTASTQNWASSGFQQPHNSFAPQQSLLLASDILNTAPSLFACSPLHSQHSSSISKAALRNALHHFLGCGLCRLVLNDYPSSGPPPLQYRPKSSVSCSHGFRRYHLARRGSRCPNCVS